MKIILILAVALPGLFYTVQHFRKNILEIKSKPKGSHSSGDLFLNYPLMVLWFSYLIVFFGGLIVNNLFLR